MNLRFIRPEDRRRSGGRGTSTGFGFDSQWADTEPACFRSEAFAEDLPANDAGTSLLPRERRHGAARVPHRRRSWVPALGSALVATLGWRLSTGD